MKMRIVVPDAASASALAERLTLVLGAERISCLEERQEVDVRVEHGSDRAILHVLDAVERWLEHASAGSERCGWETTRTGSPSGFPSRPGNESGTEETAITGVLGGMLREKGNTMSVVETPPRTLEGEANEARAHYWLEHTERFQVFGPNGRVGFVEVVVPPEGADGLVIRAELLRPRTVFVASHEVGAVVPETGRLELLIPPSVTGAPRQINPAEQRAGKGKEQMMTKHQNIAQWHGKELVDWDGESVPLGGVTIGPDNLQVSVSREQVKNAPNIETEGDELSQAGESSLYHHYQLNYTPPDTESGRRLARR